MILKHIYNLIIWFAFVWIALLAYQQLLVIYYQIIFKYI